LIVPNDIISSADIKTSNCRALLSALQDNKTVYKLHVSNSEVNAKEWNRQAPFFMEKRFVMRMMAPLLSAKHINRKISIVQHVFHQMAIKSNPSMIFALLLDDIYVHLLNRWSLEKKNLETRENMVKHYQQSKHRPYADAAKQTPTHGQGQVKKRDVMGLGSGKVSSARRPAANETKNVWDTKVDHEQYDLASLTSSTMASSEKQGSLGSTNHKYGPLYYDNQCTHACGIDCIHKRDRKDSFKGYYF
jgi:hypothetical protein